MMTIPKLTLALLAVTCATHAWADNLYGTTPDNVVNSADRYAHPRSAAAYHRVIPQEADLYDMCQNAGDVAQCVWRLNGKQYPPPLWLVKKGKELDKK